MAEVMACLTYSALSKSWQLAFHVLDSKIVWVWFSKRSCIFIVKSCVYFSQNDLSIRSGLLFHPKALLTLFVFLPNNWKGRC